MQGYLLVADLPSPPQTGDTWKLLDSIVCGNNNNNNNNNENGEEEESIVEGVVLLLQQKIQ